ncbi:hypothetical protein FACS189499_03820 [Clostridia bacterium]|nr:hypothetical protein FACS189499_03820 [Clostridia bacterium]
MNTTINANWDENRIKEAVNTHTDFRHDYAAGDTAVKFAIDTLIAFEDAREYAEGDVYDVANRLTEDENVNGSWYCSTYKAREEVLNNLDFFDIVAEYAHERGFTEGGKPTLNLLDIEHDHVLYRIIGNEMLFAGLYDAFCDNYEWADGCNIGARERAAFVAYYRGEEAETSPEDIAADITQTYDLIFNSPAEGVKVARVCSGSFNRSITSDTWHCKLTLDSGAEYILTHWQDDDNVLLLEDGEDMQEAFYILETLDKTESEKDENVTTPEESPIHFENVLAAIEFLRGRGT